ncbi:MerR family transcriptional regulator [Marinibaculum pumilum]|uniref:MerR family transcriptional regulator n=1 Tax=Marinibaculum pumilum TaxID=1766165 RepID=A0ABV7KTZ3_9PROT
MRNGSGTGGGGSGRGGDGVRRGEKSPQAFRTISEVAQDLDVPPHVLRFWETKFSQVRPLKRGGGRRYYRPEDVDLLRRIRALLYREGYTIKGVQRVLREGGPAGDAAGMRVPSADEQAAAPATGGETAQPDEGQAVADRSPLQPAEAAMAKVPGGAAGQGPLPAEEPPATAPIGAADAAPPAADGHAAGVDGGGSEPSAAVALAARDEAWRQRLGKVLLDLRTVREVLQRELQQAGS